MSTPRVNQQAIAEQLGISRTTVSRCFTNHPGINPVTRAKVFQLAAQAGYQHMETRAPGRGRGVKERTVGVLICTDREEYLRDDYASPGVELAAGVSEFGQLHGVRLELQYTDPREATLAGESYRGIEALRRKTWAGVLLIYPFPRDVVDDLEARLPVVSLVEQTGVAALNSVDVDHSRGIATIVERLYALGHRQIGFYTRRYEPEALWSVRRLSAFHEILTRLGLPYRMQNVMVAASQTDGGYDAVRRRIKAGVTAWVCAADHQAYDLIADLRRAGLRVPRDVSVTGFDGIAKPAWAPLLSTAIIPYREIGLVGGKRLLDLLGKRFGSTQRILIASRFREGETIAAPVAPRRVHKSAKHA